MSSIGSVSSSPNWTSSARTMNPARLQDHMMRKTDTDGNGSINETELQTLFDKVGVDSSTSASEVLTQADSDGSGDLSAEELGAAARSFMPPPPTTMDFAASRSSSTSAGTNSTGTTSAPQGQAGDDLFGKVDADASGGIDATEYQDLMDRMGQGNRTSNSTESQFTALDSDGDGSLSEAEFDAGRPNVASGQAPSGGPGGMAGVGGMRPPPPTGGPQAASEDSSTDDPLDTNGDGVVSLAERLAGETESTTSTNPLQALFEASDTDGDGQLSQDEATQFVEQLSQQMAATRSYEDHAQAGTRPRGSGHHLDIEV